MGSKHTQNLAVQIPLDMESEDVVPDCMDPRAIRNGLGFNRIEMAAFLGLSYHTYRSWEDPNPKYRKKPSGAARMLLRICMKRPEVIKELMDELRGS